MRGFFYFSFRRFSRTSRWFYNLRLSSLNIPQNSGKTSRVFPFKCTSLLLRSRPVQRKVLYFFKKVKHCILRVNEAKPTSETAFIVDLFLLEVERELRHVKETLFWGSWQSTDDSFSILLLKNVLVCQYATNKYC